MKTPSYPDELPLAPDDLALLPPTLAAFARKRSEALQQSNGRRKGDDTQVRRILLVLAAIGLFNFVLIAWSSIIPLPAVGVISVCGFAGSALLAVLGAISTRSRTLDLLDWAVLALALVILGALAATELYFFPAYGTDESAFVQYSAELLLHGHDPYKANLLPALTQYRVPIQFATYRLNGTIASTLAYPSLSILLVVPFIWLTHGLQSVIVAILCFLAAQMVLMHRFAPPAYRSVSIVAVLGIPFLTSYSLGGDIVTIAIPFMLVVACSWSDIGRGGRLGRGGIAKAVCLGLACSISQFPWFVTPFLLAGLWCCRRNELGVRGGSLVVTRFAGLAVATALALNAPFIAWGPRAWFSDVLGPLFQHAIPFGQGLIDASAFLRIGGGNLSDYTYASVAVLIALLAAYIVEIRRLWKVAFMLPSLVFLFSTRSLSEYVIMMVAMWLVSLLRPGSGPQIASSASRFAPTALPPGSGRLPGRRRALRVGVVAVPAAACAVFVALALLTSPPLSVTIKSVETNGQYRGIWRIQALVTNQSGATLSPHFATNASGYLTTFWNVLSGPRRLQPGQRALYTLVAPNTGSMPGVTQPFLLQVVTPSPQTISSSNLFTPESFDCFISPSYVNRVVPLGKGVTLTVELRSPYGSPVRKGGVRIALGQIIYAQNTLIPAEGRINGAPGGQSPVDAFTDSAGVARFHITDSTSQGGNPLYFQAYVDPARSFPYGYSEVVSVQWAASPRERGAGRLNRPF